jgi:hypothetical protein
MDGLLYPASLGIIALLAYVFYQNNSKLMMVVVLAIGAYIIYSHETGYTATHFKNEMLETVDKSVGNYNKEHGIEKFDPKETEKSITAEK